MQRFYGLVRSGDRFGYSPIGRTTDIFKAATGSAQFAHHPDSLRLHPGWISRLWRPPITILPDGALTCAIAEMT
ncbi:hypothetical protein H8B02_22365 [Bradyrhizobium sp. Pear77]|uniref:hypothetical protein n=1 Tax=Bradyrhizobium altum TaxID=1571202 RepID=UPI001E5BD3E8|nr:hypothetical protein [Bradyrhizobium altum]MCC8956070.1 hypothetical protein [Bradyrhizobium altum]